ncbi:hypothetical protein PTI98_006019 [Pleurotus ostreatus]|nr:hypothetical protein PTI98_006019 [Pleurotus ostreatus]
MKFSLTSSWVVAALFATSSFAAVPLSSINTADTGRYVPNEYIVEMASISGLAGKRAYTGRTVHEELYYHMHKRGVQFDVKTEYDTPDILVGASMKIESPDDIAKVAGIPGVQAIRPIILIPGPKPIESFSVSDPNDSRLSPSPMSTHTMTGVDKLHAQGILGEGIKIGIIDSGIDYKHPSLGGGFGEGFKVSGGWDFVGDRFTGSNTPVPDNDPMDCGGHGTHVAGIIAADPGNEFGVVGNAYKASISGYRVFGCGGSTTDEIIAQSLIRGYNEGMDILTLSLGGVDGWTIGTGSVVASRIAEQGRVVTIAAGNDGSDGAWYTSSPGNGISAISIGSVDNIVVSVQNVNVKGVEHAPIAYLQLLPLNVTGELPIYVTNNDTTVKDDACNPLPATTPDLSGHIVVIHRGTCTFQIKADNAAKFGAKNFLIYNSDDGELTGVSIDGYQAAMISADDGKFLVGQFAAGVEVKLEFPQNGSAATIDSPHGGLTSAFSSYGPTYDMFFKPAVSAPGGNILSTIPTAQGSWGIKSGTSMATPFAAGAAALVLQARGKGKDVSREMRDLFQTTAIPVASSKEEGSIANTVSQQGAGLVQVDRASQYKTLVSPGQLLLNDTANLDSLHTITIRNTGSESALYQLSHVAAGTAQSLKADSKWASLGPVELVDAPAGVTIIPSSVTVSPGSSRRVIVRITPPRGVDESRLPVYSGFINIASKTESLRVTYLGAAGSLKKKAILDNTDAYFEQKLPLVLTPGGEVQSEPKSYTMKDLDSPSLVYRLTFGSPAIKVDLVQKDASIKPTLTKRGWFSWLFDWGSDVDDLPIIGPLQELGYVPRNSEAPTQADNGFNVFNFIGVFANKTRIEDGEYRILLRALKVTGNPKKLGDYESWLSPVISINSTSSS